MTLYYLFLCAVLVIVTLPPRSKKEKQFKVKDKTQMVPGLDQWIMSNLVMLRKYKFIDKTYSLQLKRMSVLDCRSMEKTQAFLDMYILQSIYISVGIGIGILVILASVMAMVVSMLVFLYARFILITNKYENSMTKLEQSFPEVIQKFTDNYTVTRNVRSSLKNVVTKSSGATQRIFEVAIREIYSGVPEDVALNNLAETVDIFYAYAFVDIVILADEMGDITESLNFLVTMVREDIEGKEKSKTSHFENKMMYRMLNGIAFLGLVFNMVKFDFTKSIYLYTGTGNAIVLFWIGQYILTSVYGKISEG